MVQVIICAKFTYTLLLSSNKLHYGTQIFTRYIIINIGNRILVSDNVNISYSSIKHVMNNFIDDYKIIFSCKDCFLKYMPTTDTTYNFTWEN